MAENFKPQKTNRTFKKAEQGKITSVSERLAGLEYKSLPVRRKD